MREIWIVGEDSTALNERLFAAFVQESELPCTWRRDSNAEALVQALLEIRAGALPGLFILTSDLAFENDAYLLRKLAEMTPYKCIPRVIVTRQTLPAELSDLAYELGASSVLQFPESDDENAIQSFVQYWTRTSLLPFVSANPAVSHSN